MKKVCFFNTCKVWGGGEKWHLEIAEQLNKEKKFEVFVCAYPNKPFFERASKKMLKTFPWKIGNLGFLNVILIYRLYNFFKINKINSVIMNLPSDLKSAGIAAKLAGVEKIIYRRGSAIPIKNTFVNRFLFGKIITRVIANSEFTKKTILLNNKNIISEEKISIIYNGIDEREYLERDYEIIYKRENDEIILGNAGRLSHQKGQKYLIDIAAELKNRAINFKILIAGIGELEEELKAYSKEKGVEDEVVFLGFIDNIKSFMKTIDVFLLTSIWEGFGYVMVEAMLAEKPVIAFDTSNNSEIIDNGKTGNLVEFENIIEFCDEIEMYTRDEEVVNDFGKMGKKRVEEKFTLENCLEKIKIALN